MGKSAEPQKLNTTEEVNLADHDKVRALHSVSYFIYVSHARLYFLSCFSLRFKCSFKAVEFDEQEFDMMCCLNYPCIIFGAPYEHKIHLGKESVVESQSNICGKSKKTQPYGTFCCML